MPIASISVLRHRAAFAAASLLHLRHLPFPAAAAAAGQRNPSNVSRKLQGPSKNFLRAKQRTVREFSSLSPVLSPGDEPPLSDSQAIGTVAAAQANFMRVIVQSLPPIEEGAGGFGVELLCVVKAVLKKIKRRVLVGDKVLVGSIDWVDRRGMIENVFRRRTQVLDPPVANVDRLLVLFSMEQPKVEPF